MLARIRKFSSTIFAKVFLFIVAIPFIFWGMGDIFSSGNQNTIVKISDKKISTNEFINYINIYTPPDQNIEDNYIQKLLSSFIGEKLIAQEVKHFNIKLSDNSLSKIIKNINEFKKDGVFSRTLYEKFLVENSYSAVDFEKNILKQEKKKQLLGLISGGLVPSKAMVNLSYDKINQKRDIEILDLNDAFKNKLNISEKNINEYYQNNINNYKEIFKSFYFLELNPKNLTNSEEYGDIFFEKLDEIDDLIVNGVSLNNIVEKYNLNSPKKFTVNKLGKNKEYKKNDNFSDELYKKIFNVTENETTAFIDYKNKYYIFEINKTETVLRKLTDPNLKKEIRLIVEKNSRRNLISQLIDKINKNQFKKIDFDNLSKDENAKIRKISLNSLNDTKILKQDLISQIYLFAEKRVIVISDISLTESYLVYIDKIKNVFIDENEEDYKKYLNLSKIRLTNNLYNTYDSYLNNKYEIDINYKALDNLKNNFE